MKLDAQGWAAPLEEEVPVPLGVCSLHSVVKTFMHMLLKTRARRIREDVAGNQSVVDRRHVKAKSVVATGKQKAAVRRLANRLMAEPLQPGVVQLAERPWKLLRLKKPL